MVGAPTIDEIVVADEPETWEAAGFTVDDDRTTCRIGTTRVRLVGRADGKRIQRWSLRDATVSETSIDGLATEVSDAPPVEPAEHPNGALLIDHVVLFTPDPARSIAALEAVGLAERRTRETDTYGAPFLQTFFRAGEVIIELVGPAEPTDDGAAIFFGLAHTVADLDATKALLGDALGDPKDAVQPGRRIATLRHKLVGSSVATAFMSAGLDALTALTGESSG
jgi:hypothetical protein